VRGPSSAGTTSPNSTNRRVPAAARGQRGAVMLVTAAAVLLLMVAVLAVVDFGRVMILREQLQTAADAAALAAGLSGVQRMVKVDVYTDRGETIVCDCDDDGCTCWCEDCGVVVHTVTGLEKDLIDNEGWRAYCEPPCSCGGGSCWYEIKERWVVYNPSASRQAAESFFAANAPGGAVASWITRLNLHAYRGDPFYPSVTVYARAVIRSIAPGLMKAFPDTYSTEVCSQGDTFYKDPRSGKWVDAPPRACWRD